MASRTSRTTPNIYDNRDNGALSSLNILKNNIGIEQAQAFIKIKQKKRMITLCGLKGDETELDLSGKMSGAEDVLMLAEDIKDNRAMSKLTIGDSVTPAILELGMTEGNFSNAGLGTGGAIILASWIEHKDNWSMSILNVSNNNIGAEGAKALVPAM